MTNKKISDGDIEPSDSVTVHKKYGLTEIGPVVITFRDDQGRTMHGAFFDHYVMRRINACETFIAPDDKKSISKFEEFINSTAHAHTLGILDQKGERVVPEIIADPNSKGLLFIPGRARDSKDTSRFKYEQGLIKKAALVGQPVLGICAGSWQVWEAFGGKTRQVMHHLYTSMPRIINNGDIGNNVQIHFVQVYPNTMLSAVMKYKEKFEVNSVHWLAPDEATTPEQFEISATSLPFENNFKKNRQGEELKSEADSVEAFESKFGALIMGIQWHPEAYFKEKSGSKSVCHLDIIRFMVLAGAAYTAKRRMLDELSENPRFLQKETTAEIIEAKPLGEEVNEAQENVTSQLSTQGIFKIPVLVKKEENTKSTELDSLRLDSDLNFMNR